VHPEARFVIIHDGALLLSIHLDQFRPRKRQMRAAMKDNALTAELLQRRSR
jgi:hypothetical protein